MALGFFSMAKSSGQNVLDKRDQSPSLLERLRTHEVFTKDQCFYLNYHKFSIKSYVLDVY